MSLYQNINWILHINKKLHCCIIYKGNNVVVISNTLGGIRNENYKIQRVDSMD